MNNLKKKNRNIFQPTVRTLYLYYSDSGKAHFCIFNSCRKQQGNKQLQTITNCDKHEIKKLTNIMSKNKKNKLYIFAI